jgi:hypothetical protein
LSGLGAGRRLIELPGGQSSLVVGAPWTVTQDAVARFS